MMATGGYNTPAEDYRVAAKERDNTILGYGVERGEYTVAGPDSVRRQLDQLHKLAEVQANFLNTLAERISPLLKADLDDSPEERSTGEDAYSSTLRSEVASLARNLVNNNQTIENLTRRIDL